MNIRVIFSRKSSFFCPLHFFLKSFMIIAKSIHDRDIKWLKEPTNQVTAVEKMSMVSAKEWEPRMGEKLSTVDAVKAARH